MKKEKGAATIVTTSINTSGIVCDQSRCCHFAGILAEVIHIEFYADGKVFKSTNTVWFPLQINRLEELHPFLAN